MGTLNTMMGKLAGGTPDLYGGVRFAGGWSA